MQLERKLPRFLKPGDKIMLVAPARFASSELIEESATLLRDAGFNPVMPDGLDARENQFGGSDSHRAEVINSAFRDTTIRAVFALRGGYGCGRLLPLLDSTAFLADPTWIIGFSDITAIHAWANNLGIASLHGPVASTVPITSPEDVGLVWSTLKGSAPFKPTTTIVGGNLSVLYSLLGTPYFPNLDNSLLLLEDVDEYLYHLDRMFLAFRLAGVFEKAGGLIIGSFTDIKDNTISHGQSSDNPFGRTLDEIITDQVPKDYPVKLNNPMGHGERNFPVILGAP